MQRILSVYDWQLLKEKEAVVIESDLDHQRLVRLRVNAPRAVYVYLHQPDIGDDIFLARVEGLDELEFNVSGSYKLFAVGGELWFDTLDGTRPHVEAVDDASFTTVANRQTRNVEFEIMERKARLNQEARDAALLSLFEQQMGAMRAELETLRATSTNTGASVGDGAASGADGDQSADGASGVSGSGESGANV